VTGGPVTGSARAHVLGERVLGLPEEPSDLSRVPVDELPRNG
jgi:hypothetical protein